MREFIIAKEVVIEELSEKYGRFTIEPLERGFGITIGNSLRRVLLSSIKGAAITAVQIEGVLHEFSSLDGVLEDVTDIILNLRKIPIVLEADTPRFISMEVKGPREVKAGDFTGDPRVKIVDPDVHIATLNEDGYLSLQAKVSKGWGFLLSDQREERYEIGWIPVDAVFSPVLKVNFAVKPTRVGGETDYEKLTLDIWTNGTVSPKDALKEASSLLIRHFEPIKDNYVERVYEEEEKDTEDEVLKEISVEELGLGARTVNALVNAGITGIRQLVEMDEKTLLSLKGLGKKSVEEIKKSLEEKGYSLK